MDIAADGLDHDCNTENNSGGSAVSEVIEYAGLRVHGDFLIYS